MKLLLRLHAVKIAFVLASTIHLTLNAQSSDPVQTPDSTAVRGSIKEVLGPGWTDADVFALRAFSEPLVAASMAASSAENAAFFTAINAFLATGESESLEAFVNMYPSSRWAAAISHNLGILKYRDGFFTAAIDYWKKSWRLAQGSNDLHLRALAQQSVAQLSKMYARLGRIEELKPLLQGLNTDAAGGSARQMLESSSEALHEMEKNPSGSFKCGPFALGEIRKALGSPDPFAQAILDIPSPYQGFALSEIANLATQLGMSVQMVKWTKGADIPVPCIVNWKLGHYAAIVGKDAAGKYHVKDLTFGFDNYVTVEAIRTESSGYFLLPVKQVPKGFSMVSASEGSKVFGRGRPPNIEQNQTSDDDHKCGGGCPPYGMSGYRIHTMMVSLHVEDTPLGYTPPFGPRVDFKVSYNERETVQPANLNYTNFGRQWTHNWNGTIKVEETSKAKVVLRGGGMEEHPINPSDLNFVYIHIKSHSRLVKVSATRWERLMPDGSKEVYDSLVPPDSQGRGSFWLSSVVDPAGNAVTLQYDANYRLSTIKDAINQTTTFRYQVSGDIYKVSRVDDPFGRNASFSYNAAGQLVSITDMIGLQSQFGYAAGDIVSSMTTPYGMTTFSRGQSTPVDRWIEVTDPLGGKERAESKEQAPGIPFEEAPGEYPPYWIGVGSNYVLFLVHNQSLNYRNTFFWDKKKMLEAPGDFTKATVYHFLHSMNINATSGILESVKEPLEKRVWYNYPDQVWSAIVGSSNQPNKVARVIEDGSTQLWQYDQNALANITRSVDPLGRETLTDYAANNIDVVQVRQKNGGGYDTIASFTWNSQRLPLTVTDAAGKTTTNTYNSRGQLLTSKNALNETTTYTYDPNGYLTQIDPPAAGNSDRITFTYDTRGRLRTRAQWGFTLTYDYDNLDRLTKTSFPNGTEEITYNKLDKATFRDRLGRVTQYTYDANRHLISEKDPLNRTTQYQWCTCGQMIKLTDPKGNATEWKHDLQGRVIEKKFADNTKILSTYGTARGLLASVTDPKGQTKSFTYAKDDRRLGVSYTNAQVATPPVTWQWDAFYPRITNMQDGIGQTQYAYVAAGQNGATKLASVDGPFASDTITFAYDSLGRVNSRSINGSANTMTSTFDALGRVSTMTNGLGQFGYTYDTSKGLLSNMTYPNGEVAIYTYHSEAQDLRLNTIQRNMGQTELFFEQYLYANNGNLTSRVKRSQGVPAQTLTYSYDNADQLVSVTNPSDTSSYPQNYVYDPGANMTSSTAPSVTRAFTYNSLNERITDAGLAQQFDPNGNLSGGMSFTLTWDAEDRVKSISYNGTQKRVEYDYDGQGRRARIRLVQSGVTNTEYVYIWDGLQIVEKRDGILPAFPVAMYFPQGERKFLAGTYINYFYLRDRLNSVRGATSQTGSIIQLSDYLPYGPPSPQQPLTTDPDFGFTGHLKDPFTGLTLAPYRVLGYANWLSRDPIGESGGINLFAYVENNPTNNVDPLGLYTIDAATCKSVDQYIKSAKGAIKYINGLIADGGNALDYARHVNADGTKTGYDTGAFPGDGVIDPNTPAGIKEAYESIDSKGAWGVAKGFGRAGLGLVLGFHFGVSGLLEGRPLADASMPQLMLEGIVHGNLLQELLKIKCECKKKGM